jgi:hypothetical protein
MKLKKKINIKQTSKILKSILFRIDILCFFICYDFNQENLGRDPKLKRNNIFISKRRIYQLLEKNLIPNPEIILQEIAREI